MIERRLKRILSFVMVLVMMIGMIPTSILPTFAGYEDGEVNVRDIALILLYLDGRDVVLQ